MTRELYDFIFEKKHYEYRHRLELDLAKEYAARGLSPIERITDRFERIFDAERPVILAGEDIVFLRTVENLPAIFTAEEMAKLKKEHFIFGTVFLTNLSPNYYDTIAKGLLAKRECADEYGKRTIDAVIRLADRYLEEARRLGRTDLVEVLTHVPRYGARSFREALQFFRILHFALWIEGENHNTVGRFDRYVYPYLKADLENGAISEAEALDLLCDFFLSFNKDSDLYPGVQKGDNGQSMMLGGIDENGNEVFNLLSELCLKASARNRLIDPKINLRVNKNTPLEIYKKATELTRCGLGFPQYSNDDVVIPALEKLGYEHADAANYTVAACWEFIIPFVGFEVVNIEAMSYPKAVDRALHRALATSESFGVFFDEVVKEINADVDAICKKTDGLWFIPSPFMHILMDTESYDRGRYNNYGIHGTGIATAADSLAAIKRYVFEEKRITPDELISAVDANFENTPKLLNLLRYNSPKLGNDDDFVDSIAVQLLDAFADSLKGRKNSRGGIYRAGTGSAMYYLSHASEIGASPDGRLRAEPFGTNFSVSLFARVKGPVSVIASMTKPHFENAINGGPLTLEFHSSVFADGDGINKIATFVKRYIAMGGHQLQLNTVNLDTLLDAQAHPENHRHLIVRIWGWSAYFVDLEKKYQNHVIARQAYTL